MHPVNELLWYEQQQLKLAGSDRMWAFMMAVLRMRGKRIFGHNQEYILHWDGKQEWLQNGVLHRDGDMPAVLSTDGCKEWFINGQRHRGNNRPACVHGELRAYFEHGCLMFSVAKDGSVRAGTPEWSLQINTDGICSHGRFVEQITDFGTTSLRFHFVSGLLPVTL